VNFTEARDSEWQWHQLGRMQVCTLLQIDNHASTPTTQFLTGQMPLLPPNQQCQSTEGIVSNLLTNKIFRSLAGSEFNSIKHSPAVGVTCIGIGSIVQQQVNDA